MCLWSERTTFAWCVAVFGSSVLWVSFFILFRGIPIQKCAYEVNEIIHILVIVLRNVNGPGKPMYCGAPSRTLTPVTSTTFSTYSIISFTFQTHTSSPFPHSTNISVNLTHCPDTLIIRTTQHTSLIRHKSLPSSTHTLDKIRYGDRLISLNPARIYNCNIQLTR